VVGKGVSKRSGLWAGLAVVYVAAVLVIDAFGLTYRLFPYRWFHFLGMDLFKLITWFVIPFVFCIPWMDWAYFGFKRWRRLDYFLLGGLVIAGLIAVIAIPLIPGLREMISTSSASSFSDKVLKFIHNMMWTFSWLLGWEFLHRYLLLRRLGARWPRFGWLLIPVFEGAYHLMWWPAWAMPAAMVAFSLVVTPWALRRRNTLLPFLAHLAVELEFSAFLVLAG